MHVNIHRDASWSLKVRKQEQNGRKVTIPSDSGAVGACTGLDHSCNKYCDLIGPHRYSKSHRVLVNSHRVLVNPHRVPVNPHRVPVIFSPRHNPILLLCTMI